MTFFDEMGTTVPNHAERRSFSFDGVRATSRRSSYSDDMRDASRQSPSIVIPKNRQDFEEEQMMVDMQIRTMEMFASIKESTPRKILEAKYLEFMHLEEEEEEAQQHLMEKILSNDYVTQLHYGVEVDEECPADDESSDCEEEHDEHEHEHDHDHDHIIVESVHSPIVSADEKNHHRDRDSHGESRGGSPNQPANVWERRLLDRRAASKEFLPPQGRKARPVEDHHDHEDIFELEL